MTFPKMRNVLTFLFVACLSTLPLQFVLGLPVAGGVPTLQTSGNGKFKFPIRINLTEAAASSGAGNTACDSNSSLDLFKYIC